VEVNEALGKYKKALEVLARAEADFLRTRMALEELEAQRRVEISARLTREGMKPFASTVQDLLLQLSEVKEKRRELEKAFEVRELARAEVKKAEATLGVAKLLLEVEHAGKKV